MSKNKPAPIIVKKAEEGHAGAHGGSWKVAYADFVTAMMALFLLLWLTMALKPQQKEVISAMFQDQELPTKKAEIASMPTYVAKDAVQGAPQFKLSQDEQLRYDVALMIKQIMSQSPEVKQNSGVSSDKFGVLLHVNNAVMFQPGSATLKPEGLKVLDEVTEVLKKHKMNLVVRGHTDDTEATSSLYPSKWELSAARAAAGARYIIEKGGIQSNRVKAVGYADSVPLVPNTSDQNRAINRRVEFFYHSPDMANIM